MQTYRTKYGTVPITVVRTFSGFYAATPLVNATGFRLADAVGRVIRQHDAAVLESALLRSSES